MIERRLQDAGEYRQSRMSELGGIFMATWQSGKPLPQLAASALVLVVYAPSSCYKDPLEGHMESVVALKG